ncbi:putative lipid II flippase FtsW [bioreactor metagenome]|uniref:Putative lipid II flippase FtsW n=1 Tax=bioreactor metagenome TaxID=1076179 RepID=A0A645FM41_9ZZZZ
MIFSAICEEFGTIFGMGIVCIYILLFLRGMLIAVRSKKRFYSILTSGIVIMFSFQTFLIIGGVIKLIPLTGVTLPFVSYGGSSILVSIMLMGLLQWSNSMSLLKESKEAEEQDIEEQDTEELQTDKIQRKISERKQKKKTEKGNKNKI